MVCFFPLLFMGWLMIDLFYSEPQTVVQRKEIPEARMANKFGNLTEWNDTVKSDFIKEFDSKESCNKRIGWKQWNITINGALLNMKTGVKKTVSFFGDIIENGAVPVYVKDLSPTDSIN